MIVSSPPIVRDEGLATPDSGTTTRTAHDASRLFTTHIARTTSLRMAAGAGTGVSVQALATLLLLF